MAHRNRATVKREAESLGKDAFYESSQINLASRSAGALSSQLTSSFCFSHQSCSGTSQPTRKAAAVPVVHFHGSYVEITLPLRASPSPSRDGTASSSVPEPLNHRYKRRLLDSLQTTYSLTPGGDSAWITSLQNHKMRSKT